MRFLLQISCLNIRGYLKFGYEVLNQTAANQIAQNRTILSQTKACIAKSLCAVERREQSMTIVNRQYLFFWLCPSSSVLKKHNHCWSGKSFSILYSHCAFVALGIQHAMRMHHTRLQTVACLAHIFPHYLLNNTVWKKLLNTKCVFWFSLQLPSETWRNEQDMIKNVYWSNVKCLLFLSNFNETWIFSTDFL